MAAPTFLPGIAEPLPPDEVVRWQGGADARAVARHVFHQRVLALYLAAIVVLVGVRAALALPAADAARVVALPILLALALLGVVGGIARATARHARFVITDRRVVMQVGAGFPIAVNIPLHVITAARVRRFRDGTGEVHLDLAPAARVAWSALWPFVHPFRVTHPQPRLRGLVDPDTVSAALQAAAVADAARQGDTTTLVLGDAPAPASVAAPAPVPALAR